MPADADLGPLIRRNPTVPGRRPRLAAIQLSAAALLLMLVVSVLVPYFGADNIGRPPVGAESGASTPTACCTCATVARSSSPT